MQAQYGSRTRLVINPNLASYDLLILDGANSSAYAINNAGEVVGWGNGESRVWWVPERVVIEGPEGLITYIIGYGPQQQADLAGSLGFWALNDLGDSVCTAGVFNIRSQQLVASFSPSIFGRYGEPLNPPDLNIERQAVFGGGGEGSSSGVIYDYASPGAAPFQLPSPPSGEDVNPLGINNNGDVVGYATISQGYFYSGSTGPLVVNPVLWDINDHRLAVGATNFDHGPVLIDLSNPSSPAAPMPIPQSDAFCPASINNSGVVVGTFSAFYSTVYMSENSAGVIYSSELPAMDLNTLIPPNSGYFLYAASDINDAGCIVGTAIDGSGSSCAFVAIPRQHLEPLHPNSAYVAAQQILAPILAAGVGVSVFGQGVGPGPPFFALPAEQRDAILSFGISDLAELMGDREARIQIQRIAAQAGARAAERGKRRHNPPPKPAESPELGKVRQHRRHGKRPFPRGPAGK